MDTRAGTQRSAALPTPVSTPRRPNLGRAINVAVMFGQFSHRLARAGGRAPRQVVIRQWAGAPTAAAGHEPRPGHAPVGNGRLPRFFSPGCTPLRTRITICAAL